MRTAVVVGAGMAGLAAAGALAREGWQVTLLERGERVAAPPTALVLWPNGRRALDSLDPDGGWPGIAAPLPDGGVRRPDGQWLVAPHTRPGAGPAPAVVHLEDLYDALVAGLGDGVDIRTGVEISTVRARRATRPAVGDGRTLFEADLIVAADGIDSPVRRALAPEAAAVGSGFAAWQAVIPGYRAPSLPPDCAAGGETLGAGYRFVSMPLGERAAGRGGIYWVATAAGAPRPEPAATQLALLRRWFASWHAPVGDLLAATRPEDLVPQEVRELRPLPRAYGFRCGTGGVVLLGDAAHAMPHHLGQGACLAFEDAATLRSLVATAEPGPALHQAVEEYDRARRPRTATVVRQSRRMSAVVQARGRLALRARDAALGSLRPRILGHAHGLAADWQPPD
ncbi:monooxygenase [Actinoplanes sp. NBRC 14428]|uniref:2-polyprenyl-6-methoxyphenol hydroxylase-like FAD-dependent oxidoreductase n=1 Tax=Pseudosporangium ferrugineum TaxID=439699 RepID=A0A2T0S9E7_9ACTN|nr:NAD(P)/FAD-dependent oxidoreductase [Pseudosporangium ferrugineum]PRY30016.1 2-polyprenyl-6-methoxyphenol hydroxylase-like FAD-dependent oxidoreductase [Pseudosporangium ferrugineum]BCJ50990.1 monooxygenase [Actinoplanes sp. NBRC 14428]